LLVSHVVHAHRERHIVQPGPPSARLYSAVETGITFFSLPSFIFTFLPPSLAYPATSFWAAGGWQC